MTENLEARIARLEDLDALKKVINVYHQRADRFDWNAWAESFTEDSVFVFAESFGTMTGRQQILDICRDSMDHIYGVMQHIMINLDFELTGQDTATGHGNLIFTGIPDAAKPDQFVQSGGRYDWQFRRTPDGWRIAHSQLEFIWNNGGDSDDVFASKDAAEAA